MVIAAGASPSSPPPSAGRPHPTYKEMIVQALTNLREPSGSTRRAIANYIADHFSGLHAHHDALLSVHLRRLRSQGQLRLISGCAYLLSTAAAPPPQRRGRGRPRKNADLAASVAVPVFEGPKRGPGRPRKNAVPVALSFPPPPSGVKRGPGRPRKTAAPPPPSGVRRGPGRPRRDAPLLPYGKRRPGRPPKSAVQASLAVTPPKAVVVGKRKRGRPPKPRMQPVADAAVLPKRGPGRPRKDTTLGAGDAVAPQMAEAQSAQATDPASSVQNGGDASALQACATSLTIKRGRGRPRKRPLETETKETRIATSMGIKRGRGRPRKENLSAARSAETGDAASMGIKRGRGRPRKENPFAARSVETGHAASMGIKRGRGRPRKDRSFETGIAAAVEVSRDLMQGSPATDENLKSGKKTETEGVCPEETMDTGPADAGGVLVSEEKAAIVPVDAGRTTSGADPMDSNLGTTSL